MKNNTRIRLLWVALLLLLWVVVGLNMFQNPVGTFVLTRAYDAPVLLNTRTGEYCLSPTYGYARNTDDMEVCK